MPFDSSSTMVSMSQPPIDVKKRHKTPHSIRKPQILSLQAAGLTQDQIAAEFGVSRSAIARDLKEIRPALNDAESRLARLSSAIESVITLKQRAAKYADLALNAKNEAVSAGVLARIDDLDGIVTEKERIRAKGSEPQAIVPMFALPSGAHVSVTVNNVTLRDKAIPSVSEPPVIETTADASKED